MHNSQGAMGTSLQKNPVALCIGYRSGYQAGDMSSGAAPFFVCSVSSTDALLGVCGASSLKKLTGVGGDDSTRAPVSAVTGVEPGWSPA